MIGREFPHGLFPANYAIGVPAGFEAITSDKQSRNLPVRCTTAGLETPVPQRRDAAGLRDEAPSAGWLLLLARRPHWLQEGAVI